MCVAALWWKAWRESRGRFLSIAPVIAFACFVAAKADLSRVMVYPPPTLEQHIWTSVYDGAVRLLFVGAALLLGLGGLRAERVTGSDAFTLSLPITRLQLAATRAAMGLLQVVVLAAIPAVTVPEVTLRYQDHGYPAMQAWWFFVLFVAAGAVWFATAFVWSLTFKGEYTAAAMSLLTPIVSAGFASAPGLHALRSLNLLNLMSGAGFAYLDPRQRLLIELPWRSVSAVVAVAIVLLAVAVRLVGQDD